MGTPSTLDELRTYASDVAECARAIRIPAEQLIQRAALVELADQVVQDIDRPFRIGFVGEFSAGKSQLLGVLLGKPDLLATSSHPTTGNVTEIRFAQAADDAPTRIRRVTVRFLSGPDLATLSTAVFAELTEAAQRAGIPAASLAELDGLRNASFVEFEDWCRRVWHSPSIELRKLIRESLYTREAAEVASGWLGQTIEITEALLRQVVEIPYPQLTDEFPRRRATGIIPFSEVPTEGQLAVTFPLVDRVVLDVMLPRQVWDISSIGGHKGFVLLDFPGIGGDLTRARDLFLTRRGLTDVHTILVLVNAERPGGKAPDEFYGFLRDLDTGTETLGSRILYCAGRFDQLPPPEQLPGAAGGAETRMTEDLLVRSCSPLNALLQSGHRPGLSSMLAFASSVLAISRLGLRDVPRELQWQFYREAAEVRAKRWREIADSLMNDGTGRDLARALLSYATDGGVSWLRSVLEQHVRDHGLELRIAHANEQLDRLDELKAELETELSAQITVDPKAASDAAQARAFLGALNRYRNLLVDRQLPALRDPAAIPATGHRSLSEDVTQKAADLVMSWKEWGPIFSSVEEGVVVPPPQRYTDNPLVRRRLRKSADAVQLPQTHGEFEAPFTATCAEMRNYVQSAALAGTRRWLEARSAAPDAVRLRRQREAVLTADVLSRLVGGPLEELPQVSDSIIDPASMAGDVEDALAEKGPDYPDPQAFPLRSELFLGWADEMPPAASARHIVRVLRMRSALIDSVTQYTLECLNAVQSVVYEMLRGYFTSPETKLPDSAGQRLFKDAVVGEPGGETKPPPDPAADLAALRRPDGVSGFEG